MRHRFAALAFAGVLTLIPFAAHAQVVVAPPAEVEVTTDDVRDIAGEHGVRVIDSMRYNRYSGRWYVEGRDFRDRDVDMEIDANTGAVIDLER